jgi:hypothetical protein
MSRFQRVAPVAGWIALMAPLSAVLLSLVTSPDSNWTLRAALAGFAILAVVKPDAALLTTAALIGFGSILANLVGVPSARITEVLIVASLGGCLFRALRDNRFRSALAGQITAPIVLFAMTAIASTVVWLRVHQVETGYPSTFVTSVLLFVTRGYFSEPGEFWLLVSTAVILEGLALYIAVGVLCQLNATFFERALRMFALGGAGLAVLSVVRLAEILLRDPNVIAFLRTTPNGLRISPQIPDYIAAGSYFSLCWLIALGLAVAAPRRRIVWFAAGAPLMAALYLTGSRSVVAAALAGLVVLVLVVVVRLGASSARPVLAVAVFAVGLMLVSYPWLTGRDFSGIMAKRSLQVRVELARTSLQIIALRPLFGVGIDRYHLHSDRLASPVLKTLFPVRKNAHNDFLRVGAELGLAGLVLLLWILAAAGRRIWRALRATRDAHLAGLAGGLVAFLVTSMVSNPLLVREVSYAFWIALGLAVAHSARLLHRPPDVPETTPALVPPREAIVRSPWRSRIAVLAAAVLVLSVPFRARQELAAVDVTRLTYGLFWWETDPSGTPFRWSAEHVTLFVDGRARLVEIPLAGVALPSGQHPQVEVRVDGTLTDRMVVGPDWQRLRTILPAEPSASPRRIDLHVSPSWVPADTFPDSQDRRALGVRVGEIKVIADADMEHAGIGVSEWRRHADGSSYRAAAAESTVFVPAVTGSVSIPLRAISPECCERVELRLDGRLADVVAIGADHWRRVLVIMPPQSGGPGFRRIDVHVVGPRPATGEVLMIGKVEPH